MITWVEKGRKDYFDKYFGRDTIFNIVITGMITMVTQSNHF